MQNFKLIFLFIFPFFFVGVWYLLSWMLSFISGWDRLAERFLTKTKFEGKYYRFQSGRLNQTNFSSSLEMGVSEKGLFLVPMVLFRLFHSPLLIPWDEINVQPFKRFFFQGYRLTFRSFPDISLEVYASTFDNMLEYLKMERGFQPNTFSLPHDSRKAHKE